MHLSVEPLTATNLRDGLHLWPDRTAYSDEEFHEATATAVMLLREHRAQGVIVRAGGPVCAVGMSLFADAAFVRRYLDAPDPHLGKRLLLGTDDHAAVLTSRQIARGNAHDGLHLIVILTEINPDANGREALLGTMFRAFTDIHVGFRISLIMGELFGAANIADIKTSGAFDVHTEWSAPLSPAGLDSIVVTLWADQANARRSPYLPMFVYQPPRGGFTDAERTLLHLALDGLTDEELSACLGCSLGAVKARWRRVLDRAAERLPELFLPASEEPGDACAHRANSGRGKQVRHLVLRYVRAHPSELRPYAFEGLRHPRATPRARMRRRSIAAPPIATSASDPGSGTLGATGTSASIR